MHEEVFSTCWSLPVSFGGRKRQKTWRAATRTIEQRERFASIYFHRTSIVQKVARTKLRFLHRCPRNHRDVTCCLLLSTLENRLNEDKETTPWSIRPFEQWPNVHRALSIGLTEREKSRCRSGRDLFRRRRNARLRCLQSVFEVEGRDGVQHSEHAAGMMEDFPKDLQESSRGRPSSLSVIYLILELRVRGIFRVDRQGAKEFLIVRHCAKSELKKTRVSFFSGISEERETNGENISSKESMIASQRLLVAFGRRFGETFIRLAELMQKTRDELKGPARERRSISIERERFEEVPFQPEQCIGGGVLLLRCLTCDLFRNHGEESAEFLRIFVDLSSQFLRSGRKKQFVFERRRAKEEERDWRWCFRRHRSSSARRLDCWICLKDRQERRATDEAATYQRGRSTSRTSGETIPTAILRRSVDPRRRI